MPRPFARKSQRGFTLIEVMIAGGLLGAMALYMAEMHTNQQRQIRKLELKSDLQEFARSLSAALADPTVCAQQFSSSTIGKFDLTNASTDVNAPSRTQKTVPALYYGPTSTSLLAAKSGEKIPSVPGSPRVSSIYFSDFNKTVSAASDGRYTGFLYVGLDQDPMFGVLKPLRVRVDFVANMSEPASARSLASCAAQGAGSTLLPVNPGGGTTPSPTPTSTSTPTPSPTPPQDEPKRCPASAIDGKALPAGFHGQIAVRLMGSAAISCGNFVCQCNNGAWNCEAARGGCYSDMQ